MAKPFKFRYVSQIAGGLVLVVLAILLASIVIAGKAQGWFEPVTSLQLTFPPEGSFDLQNGADVVILGTVVGAVERITVNDDGSMSARITIRGKFIRFVRTDSRAVVKKKLGLAGDAYVEITKGTGAELPEDASLACTKDTEITEMIQQAMEEVRTNTMPAIQQGQRALEEYTKLAEDLNDPDGEVQQLLRNINSIVEGLEKGEGTAGLFLRDKKMAAQVEDMVAKLNKTVDDANKIIADMQDTSGIIKSEVEDLPGIVVQAQQTLRETTILIQAMEKHWLFRKYVEQPDQTRRIPPSSVAVGGGAL